MPRLNHDQIARCSPVVLLALTRPHQAVKVDGAYLGNFPAGGESQCATELLLSELARSELEDHEAARIVTGWAVMHVTDARRIGYFGFALAIVPRSECAKDARMFARLAGKVAAHLERLYVTACDAAMHQQSLLDDALDGPGDAKTSGVAPDLDTELDAQRLAAALSRGPLTVRVLGAPPVEIDPLDRRRQIGISFQYVGTSALRGIVDNQSWRRGRAELHGRLHRLDGGGTEVTRNIQVGVSEESFRALLPYFVERRYCEFTIDVYRAYGILGGTLVRYALKSFHAIEDADLPLFV